MPDARAILLSQIDALTRDLARTEDLLETIPTRFDPDVLERTVGAFKRLIENERVALKELRVQVEKDALDGCSKELTAISERARDVFGESLAFLQGALSRRYELDNRLCLIADSLLDELSRRCGVDWERFTILAPGELYAEMAGIIRIRFPDASVWSLPVVAHEFGHYVGPELTTKAGGRTLHPFETLLEREEQNRWKPRHVHELFADVFATYTLGPAYAFTCIAGRFDPSAPYDDEAWSTHPADGKRVHAVVSTLRRIEEQDGQTFGPFVNELVDAWAALVAGAGQPKSLEEAVGDKATAELDRLVGELYELLKARLNPDAIYGAGRFVEAQQLAAALRKKAEVGDDSAPEVGDDVKLADALNAGWITRWRHWDWTDQLGRSVFKLCDEQRLARAGA